MQMKFTTTKEALLPALQSVSGALGRGSTMPILDGVLLSAHDGNLQVTATDLEVQLSSAASVEGEDGRAVAPRKLLDIVRAVPDGEIRFELKDGRLTVRSGRSRFSLTALPAEDYPLMDTDEIKQRLTVDLFELLSTSQVAMAKNDVRYYLNGVMLEAEGNHLRAVATDGHRLAAVEVEASGPLEPGRWIIPRKAVAELTKFTDEVDLLLGASHVRVEAGRRSLSARLIEGKFPDYARVIPTPESYMTANREALKSALQRVLLLAPAYGAVGLVIDGDKLTASASNAEHGDAVETLTVESELKLEIGFNGQYLLDALSAGDSEDVSIGFAGASSACLIEDGNAKHVVMPMRM